MDSTEVQATRRRGRIPSLHDHLPRIVMWPVGVHVREDVDGRRVAECDQDGVAASGSKQMRLRLKP